MKINPTLGFAFVMLFGIGLSFWMAINVTPKEQPQPPVATCECLNYYQWTYWSTKRDRVLNNRKRSRTDSIELRNADRILGIDETLNNQPER